MRSIRVKRERAQPIFAAQRAGISSDRGLRDNALDELSAATWSNLPKLTRNEHDLLGEIVNRHGGRCSSAPSVSVQLCSNSFQIHPAFPTTGR
jgi:hypothetical protein